MFGIQTLILRRIAAFEHQFNYDMGYARQILRASLRSFRAFSGLSTLASQRQGVPLAPWTAAKWVAAQSEDCGPCQQLAIDMASQAGLSSSMLRAITQGDVHAMESDVALVYQWAQAVISVDGGEHDSDKVSAWRQAIIEKWGERGLVSLTLAMAGTRSFPMVKRALGHARSCQILRIDAA